MRGNNFKIVIYKVSLHQHADCNDINNSYVINHILWLALYYLRYMIQSSASGMISMQTYMKRVNYSST